MRRVWIVIALIVATGLAACGGGDDELTLTEYVDELNALMVDAGDRAEAIYASREGALLDPESIDLADYTPQDLKVALDMVGEIEVDVVGVARSIEAPELVADLHERMFDTRFTTAREALAERAATAESWEELSSTPEMDAYRLAIAQDKETCIDLQQELDETEARGAFADTPWIPGEMKEVVDAVLGCALWPDDPQQIYRP